MVKIMVEFVLLFVIIVFSSVTAEVPEVQNLTTLIPRPRYTCALLYKTKPHCSAAMLTKRYLLTICNRCLKRNSHIVRPHELQMQYSFFDYERDLQGTLFTHNVSEVIPHPECYNSSHVFQPKNDLGIVKLTTKIRSPEQYYAKIPVDLWGFKEKLFMLTEFSVFDGGNHERLIDATWAVQTFLVNEKYCKEMLHCEYGYDYHYCTAYSHEGRGDVNNCKYDRGMILSVREEDEDLGKDRLIGLLDFKIDCGGKLRVATFIKLTNHLDWIMGTTGYKPW